MGKVIQDQSQWGHKKVNVIKSMCDLYICVALLSIEIITTCIHEIYLSIIKIKFLFFSFMKYNLWLIVLEIAYVYVCTKKIISSFEKETQTHFGN